MFWYNPREPSATRQAARKSRSPQPVDLKRTLRARRWQAALLLAAVALTAYVAVAFWRASRALDRAAANYSSKSRIAFTSRTLARSAPADFDFMRSPAVFNGAVRFEHSIYLSGPEGLFELGPDGRFAARYRVGRDLPPYPVRALATGFLSASGRRELFIATDGGGLLIFNGRNFRQILPADRADRHLTALLPTAGGALLLGTASAGVLVFDGQSLAPFPAHFADRSVTALAGDGTNLWVGTRAHGALHWRAGRLDSLDESQGLPDRRVLSLAVSGDAAFVGTPMGVAEFVNGKFSRVLAQGFIARSLFIRHKTLRVGTLDEGVLKIPLGVHPHGVERAHAEDLPSEVVQFLKAGSDLDALARDGLYARNSEAGGWLRVAGNSRSLLSGRKISALAFDPSGRLWIGYFDRGLDLLTPNSSSVVHFEDDHVFCVNRMVWDRARAEMLVATANGLAIFDAAGRERQVLGRSDGLISEHVTDVALTRDGMVMATPAGITLADASGMRSLYAFEGLVNNHVYALAISGGRLLAGTLGGLSILQGGRVTASFTTANSGLRRNWITAIVRQGRSWLVGTYGAGILRFDDGGVWHTVPGASGHFSINMNAMMVRHGDVYAGTENHGLLVYSRSLGLWTRVTRGLPSMNVMALAVQGNQLYVGTANGLVRIPIGALDSQ